MVCGAYFLLLSVPVLQQSYQCPPVSGPGAEGGRAGRDLLNDHNNDKEIFYSEVSSPSPAAPKHRV